MAQIKNAEGLTVAQMEHELRNGAKFVIFKYCISIIIMTFNRTSDIHFVRKGESTIKFSIGYTLLTLVVGWWGIPWGPIYTIGAIFSNLSGGKDVTQEVLAQMGPPSQQANTDGQARPTNVPTNINDIPGMQN